jgi:anti-sigma B factor antagonist
MPGTRPAVRDHHDHVIVTLCGELDIADAACLRDALTGAVTQNPYVVADLSGLDFVDCAVLGVLVRARGQALAAGGDLVLAEARGRARRVLELPLMADLFPVYASVDEAVMAADGLVLR